MGAKVSAEMKYALYLVEQEGKPVKESAIMAGVNASSVYKALRRHEKSKDRLPLAKIEAAAAGLPQRGAAIGRRDAWP